MFVGVIVVWYNKIMLESHPAFKDRPHADDAPKKEGSPKYKSVFVDFGSGHNPVAESHPERFSGDTLYIGVDYDEEALKSGQQKFLDKISGSKLDQPANVLFVRAEKGALPFGDQSVSELHFGNVFGEPYHLEFKKDERPEQVFEIKDKEKVSTFIQDAHRILNDGGVLSILETYTPVDSNEKVLKEVLKENGFKIDRIVRGRDPEFKIELQKYNTSSQNIQGRGHFLGEPYILYAHKETKRSFFNRE